MKVFTTISDSQRQFTSKIRLCFDPIKFISNKASSSTSSSSSSSSSTTTTTTTMSSSQTSRGSTTFDLRLVQVQWTSLGCSQPSSPCSLHPPGSRRNGTSNLKETKHHHRRNLPSRRPVTTFAEFFTTSRLLLLVNNAGFGSE